MANRRYTEKANGGLKGTKIAGPAYETEIDPANMTEEASTAPATTDHLFGSIGGNLRKITIALIQSLVSGLVKVSNNDASPGYLLAKVLAGTGMTATEGTDGGNETLTLAVANSYTLEFDSEDLASGVLTVEHNLNQAIVGAQIWDNNGVWTRPDKMWRVDDNTLAVDLSSFNDAGLVTGTWKVWVSR